MSVYSEEFSVSSNNSINENIYNLAKMAKSPKYKLKKLLKSVTKMFLNGKKSKVAKNTYNYTSEIDDNSSNETLESRILDEIRGCDDCCHTFVPVHFARTEAGTFFWTANYQNTDSQMITDNDFNAGLQLPQLQAHSYDRWIQA